MSVIKREPGCRPYPRRWVAYALLAGLLLRLGFVWRLASISDDTRMYADLARNLLLHHTYGITDVATNNVHPTLIRLPGYPLFLVGCFSLFGVTNYNAVMLVQLLLDLGSCLLLFATTELLFSQKAGIAALWLGCLCPFLANYVAAPLTETPTLFCMALAFYCFARWQAEAVSNLWLLPLGFALGGGVLLRPEQGMLAAAIIPATLLVSRGEVRGFRERIKPALALSLLTVLPLVPWTARNWRTFHVVQPLAPRYATDPGELIPTGFQRWYRTWAVDFASTEQVYWKFDGDSINIADLPARAFDSPEQRDQTAAILADYNEDTTATPGLDARFALVAAQRVRTHPVRYFLLLPLARVLNMTLRPRLDNLNLPLDWWNVPRHPGESAVAFAYAALNLAYLVFSVETLRNRRWNPRLAPLIYAMCATVLFRCILLLTVDNSEPRYTLEFYPVLIVLAGAVAARISGAARPMN